MHEKKAKREVVQNHYYEVINAVLAACRTKRWLAQLDSKDDQYHLATISVWKQIDHVEVRALVHVTVDNGVKFSIEKTSFHSYGQKDLLEAITFKVQELGWLEKKGTKAEREKQQVQEAERVKQHLDTARLIKRILANFDKVARQLRRRHDDRAPYQIADEYDVQDLLHAILRAYFEDVRPEEYTPSYAGASSRVDFLLKDEQALIEVKFATPKLREKQIGDQLIIDIKKYQAHPDCTALYCLVYDPGGNIRNPIGFERDLSGEHDKLTATVMVVPN